MLNSIPITPLRGFVFPGPYTFDGRTRWGWRKDRAKRLFSLSRWFWKWGDGKPEWLQRLVWFEFGLNVYSLKQRQGLQRYRRRAIKLLMDHYDIELVIYPEYDWREPVDKRPLMLEDLSNDFCEMGQNLCPTINIRSRIDGGHVGDPETALMFLRRGIKPQRIHPEKPTTCSIGFCEREQKWYGWSHRAISGFGIGSTVKPGDCAYVADTPEGLIEDNARFYGDLDTANPNLVRAQQARDECEILPDRSGIIIHHKRVVTPVALDMDEVIKSIASEVDLPEEPIFACEPETIKCGRGTWTARTLDDARQMAIDFAEDVS